MDELDSSAVSTDWVDVRVFKTENISIQVTTIRFNKDNYLRWSAAITMGIAGLGRIIYVNGKKTEPLEASPTLDMWFLEDNQIRELRAYLSRIETSQVESSDDVKVNRALAISGEKDFLEHKKDDGYSTRNEEERDRLFGQVYSRRRLIAIELTSELTATRIPILILYLPWMTQVVSVRCRSKVVRQKLEMKAGGMGGPSGFTRAVGLTLSLTRRVTHCSQKGDQIMY
ncbi:hypothetical protein EJ110_NYTH36805 [Nymphaea thermarum]|nr:hypothetical protein EJ110_NYTH36805 [Nymphaea thermarum]